MATKKNAPYKILQRRAERALKGGKVLWVSCRLVDDGQGGLIKIPVQGTYNIEHCRVNWDNQLQ